jgi:hypothetical protein
MVTASDRALHGSQVASEAASYMIGEIITMSGGL